MTTLDQILARWLNIPVAEWPPNAYRWLGLQEFEDDEQVINEAADKLMRLLHILKKESEQRQTPHQKTLAYLMNQTEQRRAVLTNRHPRLGKAEYDARLRRELVYFSLIKKHQEKPTQPPSPPITTKQPSPPKTPVPAPPVITKETGKTTHHRAIAHPTRPLIYRRKRSTARYIAQFISVVLGMMCGTILGYFFLLWLKSQLNIDTLF